MHRNVERIILISAILFLILICLKLFYTVLELYKREQLVRLYPIVSSNKLLDLEEINSEKKLYLLLGDSHVSGWTNYNFPDSISVLNKGVGGETSSQILLRTKAITEQIKPDLVIFQAGINDIKSIAVFPEFKNHIITQCKSNIKQILNLFHQQGSKVILTEIIPPAKVSLQRKIIWDDAIYKEVKLFNTWLYTLEDSNTVVLNCNKSLIEKDRLSDKFKKDDLHLNSIGYELFNECVTEYLFKD